MNAVLARCERQSRHDYQRSLLDASERLERFILSNAPTDDEYDEYMCESGLYQADVALLIKEARKIVVGLGWYDADSTGKVMDPDGQKIQKRAKDAGARKQRK